MTDSGPQSASGRTNRPIGKYQVLAELGRGGMATVFLAVAIGPGGFNKLVVLKQLLPSLASDPNSLKAFREEAKLAARLNHPNVVQTYEVGQQGHNDVIVMEYLEGQTLSSLIERARGDEGAPTRLPLAMHLRILADALAGLHHAHELRDYDGKPLRLVHRDVSPHNILVTYEGQVKLVDFGIAKAATSSTHTEEGVLKGKVAYMSPEQVLGDPLDRRSDLFAVGVMLWEAATGTRLWKEVADVTILQRVANGAIPSARSAKPDLDPELERIIQKALAQEPKQRYATAEEFQADLEAYLPSVGPAQAPKAIGRLVSSLFDEERKAMAATIEAKLSGMPPEGDVDEVPALNGPPSASTDNTYSLRTNPEGQAQPRPPAPSRATLVAMAAGAALAVIGLLAWRTLVPHAQTPPPVRVALSQAEPPPPAPSALSSPAPSAPAPPRMVDLRVSVIPSEAKIFLDDEPLPNPVIKEFLLDPRPRKLRAEARGYQTKVVDVTFSDDVSLSLSLDKAPAAGAAPPRPPQKSPTEAPKPNCDNPFYVDSRGIKTLRPECR